MRAFGISSWLKRLRPSVRAQRARRSHLGPQAMWVYRGLLTAVVITSLTYFIPYQRPYHVPSLRLGATAAEDIQAPFLFPVYKSEQQLSAERHEAAASVPVLLDSLPDVADQQLARLDSVFGVLIPTIRMDIPDTLKQRHLRRALPSIVGSMSVSAITTLTEVLSQSSAPYVRDFRATCRQILTELYDNGIVASKTPIRSMPSERIRLGRGAQAKEVGLDAVHSAEELRQGKILDYIGRYRTITERGAAEAVHELLSLFIVPNLRPDFAETRRLQAEARRGVAPVKRLYRPGDTIIEKGETVTQEHMEALEAFADEATKQELANPLKRLLLVFAAAVIASALTLALGFFLAVQEPDLFGRPWHLVLLALLLLATAASASYIRSELWAPDLQTELWVPYLVPVPLPVMLATILFSPKVGLALAYIIALYTGTVFGDFYVCLIAAMTGTVAVFAVRRVRHRNQFFPAIVLLVITYTLLIAAADVLRFVPLGGEMGKHIMLGATIGIASPILTIGLLPIFESIFQITTDITLLELSDLNRPLLRELAIQAPGTYTHSLIMANLSESAAEAIGANPLHTRVGCYYHDIGKITKPEYYSENQGMRGGRNPHDHLTPSMSMLIIGSHVKEGLELAEAHGLPRDIADLIPQHHGTTVIEYFYNRAVELGDQSARRDDFRYDGPRPQTKEAGILMLADSVESAARTLTERTPNRVRQLVRNIIQQKFTAGELDECALTLQDLHKIEDSFVPVLMGTLHGRVEYPWQKAERRQLASVRGS